MSSSSSISFGPPYVCRKIIDDGCEEIHNKAYRICQILLQVSFPSEEELKLRGSLLPHESVQETSCQKHSRFKFEYSSCWIKLLPLFPPRKLESLLISLGTKILPYLVQPCLLAGFLSNVYRSGGLNGILALDGLFLLIRDHNLDFPEFYDYLYALLDIKTLSSPHRCQLLKSLRLFMSSTMVPAYVVAGIAKRMARICLFAPSELVLWIIPFIYNLLLQNPVCRVLIHRDFESGWADPFSPLETRLSQCRAIESSLWELAMVQSHFLPRISKLATIFREKFTKPPFDLDEIATELDSHIFPCMTREELTHRWSRRPPTRSLPSAGLFDTY